ncbi:heterokaryon incompatibility protein-domain-containing protein [Fusarium flagelliforme]|uniref:heterokaryon incompatibility protein-domain-containing protein n=1 Tax=Fusarium flagelliforme TaxID=2675880 RepID=UPI001E8E3DAF|nr:heterokaryon incompatibility protein-domain-containing protein [Fusarium flagelliforme]KAH7179865.1 heterokaryon incompatibility protein-domain-containing protein [Fusarium flagelliforme]
MDSSSENFYSARILDQDDSFRLISLDPGPAYTPLTLRLLNATVHDAPPYEAVSYVWGDTNRTASVEVQGSNTAEPAKFPITQNCQDALKSLKQTSSSRILWIDSICIDQSSASEKTHQLNLMAQIYQSASQVLVFLGKGTEASDLAMEFIRELDQPSDYGIHNTGGGISSTGHGEREAVNLLFKRPWFYRVWVLQEITFAQRATVICGNCQVPWESFKELYHWNLGSRWVEKLPYSLGYAATWNRYIPNLAYSDRLLKALRETRFCGATDPRDRLYAILPLLDREHEEMRSSIELSNIRWELDEKEVQQMNIRQQPLKFRPNYDKSVKEVYTDLATILLRTIGLDLLTYVIGESSVQGLPSWVPDWTTSSPYWASRAPRIARQKPFSGYPEGPPHLFWGWKALYPHLIDTWNCSVYTQNDENSIQLHVRGVSIGKIGQLGELCDIGNDYFPISQWASLLPNSPFVRSQDDYDPTSWHSVTSLSPFAMTLAMNDVVYPKAVNDVITYIRRYNGDMVEVPEEAHNSFGTPSKDEKERVPLKECFAYGPSYDKQALWILKHCDGKRFMVLDDGSIGLAPDRAQVGDKVFVVQGASTPFALRSINSQITNLDSQPTGSKVEKLYSLVGEVFVHDFMDGEIWDLVAKEVKLVENIILR